MMKKRIFILSFAILFLVSTIGLPVYYHYCEMMQKKSLNECEVCAEEKEEVSSCCSKEVSENTVKFSSDRPMCCQDEFVYNKVEDEFVNIKNDANYSTSSDVLLQSTVLIPHAFDFSLEGSFYCDTSPPFLINPELYISNSILLI
jgi:hypothetical protein